MGQYWSSKKERDWSTYARAYFSMKIHEEEGTRKPDLPSCQVFPVYSPLASLSTATWHLWIVPRSKLHLRQGLLGVAEFEVEYGVYESWFRFVGGLLGAFGTQRNR